MRIIGNVSFPSGSDSTALKVVQTKKMLAEGCAEIDMVINGGKLRSGRYEEVEEDVRAVVETAKSVPVKVIIEVPCLERPDVEKACEICINTGAAFIKTGTGWMPRGTTADDVRLIKSIVGDKIKINASGGIRDLNTLIEMYRLGAVRFGVKLRGGRSILEECLAAGGKVEIR